MTCYTIILPPTYFIFYLTENDILHLITMSKCIRTY